MPVTSAASLLQSISRGVAEPRPSGPPTGQAPAGDPAAARRPRSPARASGGQKILEPPDAPRPDAPRGSYVDIKA